MRSWLAPHFRPRFPCRHWNGQKRAGGGPLGGKPMRKFVEPDSLLAEICNRIADAIEDAFGWQARALNAGQVKEIVESTCAEWYANLPSEKAHFVQTVVNSDREPEKGS
jgi:hypothetical protein